MADSKHELVNTWDDGYGSGVEYAYTMVHDQPRSRKAA